VVAVAGSNGKTTTKELLRAALGAKFRVHATEANLNNQVGVRSPCSPRLRTRRCW
jgi:UDP-N-acetylmuramoyl-tripeptide--D-alanyl-D-alanine ligase